MTAARPRFRSPAEHVNASAYDVVTDRVVALLEHGTVPWRRPWSTVVDAPRNLQGRRYQGINTWLLGGQGYGSPYWGSSLFRVGEHSYVSQDVEERLHLVPLP